ncbi:hypothetical protein [Miniphocaeibacter massiliensis]|uniref:hypothetical protein n=1 Tax=Miniphocaeibacter massiliensis TaxID=2041841 RepID=UPI000C1BF558|nr:hypothetical protein [Miniphocaeibacter massiliensis]
MKIVCISSEDKTRKNLYISSLSSFLSKDAKVLVVNMDDNRDLEILFEVENYIIYDNLDYFSQICNLEQGKTEVNDNLDILPSAFKKDKYTLKDEDYKKLNNIKGYDYLILNMELRKINLVDDVELISENIENIENIKKYFINNRIVRSKINRRKKEEIEKEGYIVIADKLIDSNISNEDLYEIWEVYLGISEYKMDRNIIERIFNL